MNEARFTPANTDGDPTQAKVLNPSLKTPERLLRGGPRGEYADARRRGEARASQGR
jgi:hypothetical protein